MVENENTAQAKEAYSYGYSTPDYLLPKMDGVSVSEPAFYKSLYILGTLHENTSDGQLEALDKPVDPFETRASGNAEIETRPAFGVLTVHRQSWVQRGIALGNVIQSVCLAPGEVTQVAVIDWRRQTSGTSTDTDEQGEAVTSAIDQQRAVNEVQQAVAREAQSGRSSTSASSASTQASLSGASLMLSGSTAAAAATSTALTAQFSTGARNLAAQSSNALSQRTAERSSALRSRRSTVVREVSEHETETLSTRVLVNYNRRHTLNVEYFEVLQLYALTTKLHSWERCLFVPLKPIDFNLPEQIVKHRVSLQAIFESLGRSDLIARLVSDFNTAKHADSLDLRIKALEQEISNDEAESRVHADVVKACTEALGALHMYQQGASRRDSSGEPFKRAALSTYRKISDAHREDFPADLLAARDDDLKANQTERALKRDIANGRAVGRRQDLSKIKAERFALNLSLSEYLTANRLFLSQQIWLRMDAYQNYRTLSRYKVNGKALASLIDPNPIGVFGNYLAFRWGFGNDSAAFEAFKNAHMSDGTTAKDEVVEAEIALPTSGVFAEAVLGRGEAAEKKDDTRLWKWDEEAQIPILPPKIAKVSSRDRAKDIDLSSAGLAASLAALRASDMPNVSHLANLLQQLGSSSMFRDMGGLAQAVTLADKLAAISGSGATEAGKRSQEMHAKFLDSFIAFLETDAAKAALSEAIAPGSGAGAALLGSSTRNTDGGKPKSKAKSPATPGAATAPRDAAAAPKPTGGAGGDDLADTLGAPDPR